MMTIQFLKIALLLLLVSLISGCAGQQMRMKSSVVDYLYPKKEVVSAEPSIPTLRLPVKLGIAFVPENRSDTRGFHFWAGARNRAGLTEVKKVKLLDTIVEHFKKYEFISNIEVIPSAYLTPGGSFPNLEQVGTMYDIDVIALVSYDQMQFTNEGSLSFSYLTIVGAYFVPAGKNDTSTLIDTTVFDIKSRKMLFRAPGVSNIKGRATPVNLNAELRKDSVKSFEQATMDMISNLNSELARFKDRVKETPQDIKVTVRSGYSSGGGAFDVGVLLCLMAWLILRLAEKATPVRVMARAYLKTIRCGFSLEQQQ